MSRSQAGGVPGSRTPHLWRERHGKRISTLDLAGRHVLLAGAASSAWMEAAKEMSPESRGLSLDAFCSGRDLADLERCFPGAYGISASASVFDKLCTRVSGRDVAAQGTNRIDSTPRQL